VPELFHPKNAPKTEAARRIYARYEIGHTMVDFLSAALFLVGSVLFFWGSTTFFATWLFVIGSCCFGLKPTIRLAREFHMYRLGQIDDLVRRELNEL